MEDERYVRVSSMSFSRMSNRSLQFPLLPLDIALVANDMLSVHVCEVFPLSAGLGHSGFGERVEKGSVSRHGRARWSILATLAALYAITIERPIV